MTELKKALQDCLKAYCLEAPHRIANGGYELDFRDYIIHYGMKKKPNRQFQKEIHCKSTNQRTDLRIDNLFFELKHNFIKQATEAIERTKSDLEKLIKNHGKASYVLLLITKPKKSNKHTSYKKEIKKYLTKKLKESFIRQKTTELKAMKIASSFYRTSDDNNYGEVELYLIPCSR